MVPFCIIGAIKESSHQVIEGEKEDMYEYGTLIGHFIMIFIISVAFGWLSVHVMMKSDTLGQLIMYIDNTFVLKCFCIGFTILNGLLLPFLLPLGCYEICRCREWWLRRKAYRGAKKFKKVFLDKLAKEAASIKVD